ncbi:winged helix-turn-helix transcriptional regulator [Nocardiopsis changdeensis]|uniref:Helix-turn-helix transcriptional regulator n=1 Tax=Nocardiopsis changdeensis TaxID=2831969 RepID=A0ABX8BV44_9ACTN|nr:MULTISPECIES: helix-turn-helix domain-containing protein [Nocardiopsis]QUX26074.1 helix-turn-helix transcriptional regulator [Nocardiopsis changdeensis]QYX40548.1 helix-turn-helix transcriptional regulator [Nocardiopsis sp. MT53]
MTGGLPKGEVFSADCPSRRLLGEVTSKWGVLVLVALREGPLRWSELLRRIGGVSEKMLARTLRSFEAEGLVLRDARPVVPPHVEYSLTEAGHEVTARLVPLVAWAEEHAVRTSGAGDRAHG